MADPLSISASLLAVVTAAIQSTKSLYETVKRFKDRNKTLRRLQDELKDLTNVLNSLAKVIEVETSVLSLLQGPIDRCSQVCSEFELSMKRFDSNSKMGLRDWAKMEFRRSDINEFIDTIAGYKSTISVGLGTITLQTSKVSQRVLQDYNEMIQDTTHDLKDHLRRIDEQLARITTENSNPDMTIDLRDERAVTKQCIRICEDANSYIETLSNREPALVEEPAQGTSTDFVRESFEAQRLTRRAMSENRDHLAETIGRLRERLERLDADPTNESERSRLREEIDISKQCLDVCQLASEVSHRKIYRIGEVIADGDSDQVVVTTLADLFDVERALSKGNSAQLIGSMTEETLRHMTDKRYSSRFGAVSGGSGHTQATPASPPSDLETPANTRPVPPRAGYEEQSPGPDARRNRPSPNEMRKRAGG